MDDLNTRQSSLSRFDLIILPTLFLVLAVICLFTIDETVAGYFSHSRLQGEFKKFVNTAEHFGTPYGQFLVLFCFSVANACQDRRVYRIFIGTCAAGLAANVVKLFIGRTRPREFDFSQNNIFESFTGLFPFHSGGSAIESFPSAHTASAFGFAALLTWAFPKGKSAFLTLAFLVGLQRVSNSSHYPSDIFVGAALGWLIGLSFIGNNWGTRKFQKFENALLKTQNPAEPETSQTSSVE
ncbi:phosphatase PAP2 family protein [Thalassoglobus polymorphus]|uniref:PAP2 superfamily protein n=1 Tax=Thalassoglobus polymorphus TaxID=2527994 RepID=A0A517QUI4_9PLAN|nr:phosphatase PAP2 family protein [Thalassoglobus polymorphus]QDT35275.1 PAP2 superfamily protein [Thalassoglobus polymorphus]